MVKSKSPKLSTIELLSPNETVYSVKGYSDLLAIGNVIAANTNAFAIKVPYAIVAALKLHVPKFAVNAWGISNLPRPSVTFGTLKAFPLAWAYCLICLLELWNAFFISLPISFLILATPTLSTRNF